MSVIKKMHFCKVVYISFSFLAVGSHDFFLTEKEITASKVEQIHKVTNIFTQNDNLGPF